MLGKTVIFMLAATSLAACEGRRNPAPVVVEGDAPVQGDSEEVGSSEAEETSSSSSGTPSNENPQEKTGLSAEDFSRGRVFVNQWSGEQDEVPADSPWHIKTVRGSQNETAVGSVPGPSPSSPATTTPTSTTPATSTPSSGQTGNVTEFRIPKGTGKGAWNTQATEVVLKVGVKFVIINDDTVTHQWHTNGSPCAHGKPIAPGGREECVPSQVYSSGPLYDHISNGKFYVRAEK
jgi:hypothetical protein